MTASLLSGAAMLAVASGADGLAIALAEGVAAAGAAVSLAGVPEPAPGPSSDAKSTRAV